MKTINAYIAVATAVLLASSGVCLGSDEGQTVQNQRCAQFGIIASQYWSAPSSEKPVLATLLRGSNLTHGAVGALLGAGDQPTAEAARRVSEAHCLVLSGDVLTNR